MPFRVQPRSLDGQIQPPSDDFEHYIYTKKITENC